jgi:glycosyltransferase involved in cell wall biosynthesis
VHVLPHTTPEHMNYVYSRARAVLVPSRSESYCKVVAEALFQGVPVIASNLPAIREVGGDYITYVDADDEDAWGDRVREMEDPRRHTMMADLAYQRGQHLARETIDTLEAWAQAVACIHIPKG